MAAPGWESWVVAHHGLFHGLGLSHDHAPWRPRPNNGGYTVKIPALKHWLYMLIPQVMKNGHRFHREKHFLLAGIWSMSILRKPRLESFESVYVWVPRAGITLFLFPDSFFALHIPSYGRKNEWIQYYSILKQNFWRCIWHWRMEWLVCGHW